jgi:hypothetical protein
LYRLSDKNSRLIAGFYNVAEIDEAVWKMEDNTG